ncbi:MAG: flagellar export protein FliJ [Deltaproteobacteria bacterium]|jgi:flagellar export protein FliJ|nr:flagellar export protein FliJ [Deltaproteobacteria bacterium]
MPAFKFKLNFLLKLRQKKEEEAATRLAKRLKSIRDLEAKISTIELDREKNSQEQSLKVQAGTLTPPLVALYGEYQTKLLEDLKKSHELLVLSNREKNKEQTLLKKLAIERQLLEKYQERQLENWKQEEQHREQQILEEMASLVRDRKLRNSEDENT